MLEEEYSAAIDAMFAEMGDAGSTVRAAVMNVRINAVRTEFRADYNINIAYERKPGRIGKQSTVDQALPNTFFGATSRIQIPMTDRVYVLRPMEMGGPVHLLYQLKPTAVLPQHHGEVLNPDKGPEDIRSQQDYVGDDPRLVILQQIEAENAR